MGRKPMLLHELKEQIEWMMENGYGDDTIVYIYDTEEGSFHPLLEAVDDDAMGPKALELHTDLSKDYDPFEGVPGTAKKKGS